MSRAFALSLFVLASGCAELEEHPWSERLRPSSARLPDATEADEASTASGAAPPVAPAPDSDGPPGPAPAPEVDPGSQPPATEPGGQAPPGRVKGLVGVGYGGLRIVSRDGGSTWTRAAVEANGGLDDFNLLRAVAYANGRWLAVGWGATTSSDGVTWSPLSRINEPGGVTWNGASVCGLTEGLTSDGDAFYVACGTPSQVFRSTDGTNWTALGTIGDLGVHPALAFRDGVFVASGDSGPSYRSTNASTWAVLPGLVQATFCEGTWKSRVDCHDASWFGGAYFRGVWQSRVDRSTDGASFSTVHDDSSNNSIYRPRAIAEGWVSP